jgi:hypothetical protein
VAYYFGHPPRRTPTASAADVAPQCELDFIAASMTLRVRQLQKKEPLPDRAAAPFLP